MSNRQLLMGLIVFLTTVFPAIPQTAQTRYLLVERGFSGDINALYVSEQQDLIVVQLDGGSRSQNGDDPDAPVWKPLKELAIQAWVLSGNGTALVQRSRGGADICNAGYCTDTMEFSFERASPADVSAVVLRVDGKLFVRQLKSSQ